MKKLFTLLLLLFLWAGVSWGQSVSGYTFAGSSGTFTPITGGTVIATAAFDDGVYNANNIGFTFNYNGANYTQFSLNANGWICMGATAVSSYTPISTGTSNNVISAMGNDLQGVAATGEISYKLVGSAPNRSCVVQFLHIGKYLSTGTTDDWSFQIILNETSNTINIVYGAYTTNATASTVQVGLRGASTSDYNNRTTTTSWAATTAGASNSASCTISNTVYPASGQVFTYSPPPPCVAPAAQPTLLTFTPSLNSIAGSFTAASGVDDYLVVRSLSSSLSASPVNGTRYTAGTAFGGGVVDYYGTATSFTSNGLAANTYYYYFVFSANDATCSGGPLYLTSSPLSDLVSTATPGTVTSTATGGLWSATGTWAGGVVPTASDNVTIVSGATVSVDAAANTCYNLTIDAGGTVNATGTSGVLTVASNLTNNGTLDLWTSASQLAGLVFTTATNNTFSGTGATTDINTLTVNKGTANTNILEMNLSNFSNKGVSVTSTAGFLTLTNGMLKISGTNTYSGYVFTTAGYTIGATTGFWLNNPNFTVTAQNGSPTLNGHLRISDGTLNVGTASGNSFGLGSGSKQTIEGGFINVAGRFAVSTSTNVLNYSQSGGAITVCTVGNTSTTYASFDLGTATTGVFNLTGGTITIQLAGTGTSGPRDFRAPIAIWPTFTGTTLYLGNALSGAAKTFRIIGAVPPMVISTTSANHNVATTGSVYYYGSLTIPTGCDLNLSGYGFWMFGASCVNNGTITASTSGSRFDFANGLLGSTTAQDYSGTGTFGAPASTTNLSLGVNNGQDVTINSVINVLRVNLFQGNVKGSGNITLGNGGTGACFVQIGVSGATTPGGNFDVSPSYNLGSGTHTVLYEPETTPRITGYEIPPARSVSSLSINNTNGVTISGGNINLASAGIFYLTAGILHTSAGNMVALTNSASTAISGGSATSYVDGPMTRSFDASRTATGTFTTATQFPVGKGAAYRPLWVDPTTTAGGPVVFKGEAFTTNSGTGGAGVSGLSTDRWEAVVTSGGANLTSSFVQVSDPAAVSGNQILQASAGNGVYGAIPSATSFTAGTPNSLLTTTGSQIPAAAYLGYFAFGNLTPCSVPGDQPSALVANYITSTGFTGSFTAAPSAPSHYLIVRYPAASATTAPVNYTSYAVGATLGAGTVVAASPSTTFVQSGLTAATTYDYYVYSFNNSGCYGPVYLTAAPLFGSVTTCAAAIGTPGTPVSSLENTNSFTATWTASSTAGVTYFLDVATNSTFTSFVSGYNQLNVGSVLTWPVTGLSSGTVYYVRVNAQSGSCYSLYSSTLTVTTDCDPSGIPYVQDFESAVTPAIPLCTKIQNAGSGNNWFTASVAAYGFSSKVLQYSYNSTYAANAWFYTQGLNLTAGTSYRLHYKYGNNSTTFVPEKLKVAVGTTRAPGSMTTIADHPNINTASATLAYVDFVPSTSGVYYFGFNAYSDADMYYLYVDDILVDLTPPDPLLTVSPTSLALGYSPNGGYSAVQTYTVSGVFLTGAPGNIVVTAPANFEVSTDGSSFFPTVNVPYASATLTPATISVRCAATAINTLYSGNITNAGGGSATKNVAVTGSSYIISQYCTSKASNVDDEEIFSVTVNGATNAYDCYTIAPGPGSLLNQYSNFTTLPSLTTLQRTATVPFTVLEDECDGSPYYSNGCAIWIDFNQDGDFADAGEQVYTQTGTIASPRTITGNITIPSEAILGTTVMRVTVAESYSGATLTPCLSYGYGETEDYLVTIAPAPACSQPSNALATAFGHQANISWTETGSAALWDVEFGATPYTPTGVPTPGYENLSATNAVLTGLTPLTGYVYYVRANCGAGSYSAWTSKTFTTTASCPAPTLPVATGVTTTDASLNWTVNGLETQWDIEWGVAGFVAGSGIGYTEILGTSTKPYLLTGVLSPATAYDFYVRAACGAGDASTWVKGSFTTACVAATVPWNESFETVTTPALPSCWLKENGDWITTTNSNSTNDADAYTGTQFLRESWSATNEYVWTPGLTLTAGTSYNFSFWWAGDTYSGWTGDVFYNTAQSSTGATQLGSSFVTSGTVTTKTYAQVTNEFVAPASGTYYFAIRVNCPTSTPWYLSFDDFSVSAVSTNKTLNVKAFIEGFWNGSGMNQVQDADLDYNVFNKFPGTTVDTLSVLLAEADSPWAYLTEAHAVNINPDGTMSITIPGTFAGSYYIVIKQRNSVETWSAAAVDFSGATISYDFTTSASQAYGSNQKDLLGDGSVWGIYSGDFTSSSTGVKDEYVDFFDLNEIFNLNLNSAFGFQPADLTGDGFVDFFDVNMAYNNNLNSVGMNTPVNPAKKRPNSGGMNSNR